MRFSAHVDCLKVDMHCPAGKHDHKPLSLSARLCNLNFRSGHVEIDVTFQHGSARVGRDEVQLVRSKVGLDLIRNGPKRVIDECGACAHLCFDFCAECG
jgi:hypothetical protein